MALSLIRSDWLTMENFTGPYAMTSYKYSEALGSALFPLIYRQIVLQFLVYHNNHPPLPFRIGSLATVTIGHYGPQNYSLGYAFYVVVRDLIPIRSQRNKRCTQVVVEVHVIPGHIMDWCLAGAELWAEPPRHTCYVQPHAFLSLYYCAAEYNHMDIMTIKMTFDAGTTL
jgi:hypothetical protein